MTPCCCRNLPALFSVSIVVDISRAAPASVPESKSIWGITIRHEPAPSPEDGPPASANVLRDHGKLKHKVVSIVVAYLAWALVTSLAVFLVGRRLRRDQQGSDQTPKMEIPKPTGTITLREIEAGPRSPVSALSPKSPGKMASIKSWAKNHNKSKQAGADLSTVTSQIDERVVDEDRNRNMDEMAKLYAAVMAHDEERGSNRAQSSVGSSPILEDPITPKSPSYPPEMAHPAYNPPGSPRAYQGNNRDLTPKPSMSMDTDEQQLLNGEPAPRRTKNSALSIISSKASKFTSSNSKVRPSPITVRGQPISKPMGSADLRQSVLTPPHSAVPSSVQSPGPPPPPPGKTPLPAVEEIEMHGRPQLTSLANTASTNQAKALPFRQYQDALKSAPPTKTTFLDRMASGANGPKTGVPKTPYSPYCPNTPMTPMTPRRLLSKEEIKKNKKQYALKVVEENEMVKSESDMWGT